MFLSGHGLSGSPPFVKLAGLKNISIWSSETSIFFFSLKVISIVHLPNALARAQASQLATESLSMTKIWFDSRKAKCESFWLARIQVFFKKNQELEIFCHLSWNWHPITPLTLHHPTMAAFLQQCSPYQAVTGKIYRLKQHFLPPATVWRFTNIK